MPAELGGPEKRSALRSSSRAIKIRSAPPSKSVIPAERLFPLSLSWSHYTLLMRVENRNARAFYEIEAARESWSTRELERQIASLLFERLAKSRNKEALLTVGCRSEGWTGAV